MNHFIQVGDDIINISHVTRIWMWATDEGEAALTVAFVDGDKSEFFDEDAVILHAYFTGIAQILSLVKREVK